jgi:demethylmenaquinone methyltransferase/2-methoxy-6-polyprenyl-1,4-benzoquinol methylase
MDDRSGADTVRRFFTGTGTTYDRIVNLATLGFDRRWKGEILKKIPPWSAAILDQACGTGILTLDIARRFPHARIIGVDVTEEYLRIAREKVRTTGLWNVELILGRAEDVLPETGIDCVTSSYLAKYADLDRLVGNIGRMLRPGGVAILHDFTYPARRAFARAWELYFTLLQTVGPWRYPAWRPAFEGLPGLLRETDWVGRLQRLLEEQGFCEGAVQSLFLGTSAIVSARRG